MAGRQLIMKSTPADTEKLPRKITRKKTKKTETSNEDQAFIDAQAAVAQYENRRLTLYEAREEFEAAYPDACDALRELARIEDRLVEEKADAKEKVGTARQTVGEFDCRPKESKPGYVSGKVLSTLSTLSPDRLKSAFDKLFIKGALTNLTLNKDKTIAVLSKDPSLSRAFENAYSKGGDPLTAAVTTPSEALWLR